MERRLGGWAGSERHAERTAWVDERSDRESDASLTVHIPRGAAAGADEGGPEVAREAVAERDGPTSVTRREYEKRMRLSDSRSVP